MRPDLSLRHALALTLTTLALAGCGPGSDDKDGTDDGCDPEYGTGVTTYGDPTVAVPCPGTTGDTTDHTDPTNTTHPYAGQYRWVRIVDTSPPGETARVSYVQNYTGDEDRYDWEVVTWAFGGASDPDHADETEAVGDKGWCDGSDDWLDLGGPDGEIVIESLIELTADHYLTIGVCDPGSVFVYVAGGPNGPWETVELNAYHGFHIP